MYSAVAIFRVVDTSPGSFVADQFGFEEGVERLGEGVIVAVSFRHELKTMNDPTVVVEEVTSLPELIAA